MSKHKQELLEHYKRREPQAFWQFDAFADVIPGSVMTPDEEGDCLCSSVTHELMSGAYALRVLIHPDTTPRKARTLLKKIAKGFKQPDSFDWHKEQLAQREARAVLDIGHNYSADMDLPF